MWRGLLRTMRPHQWVKNLFVLAPVVFAQELFDGPRAIGALLGFAGFCLLASSVYLLNDLVDVEADRAHPAKQKRPIASGQVSVTAARVALGLLAATAIGGGLWLGPGYAATVAGYFVLNVAYSYGLKRVAYVDVLCIATGFELRVLAGAFAADVPASTYLLVVTFLLASFLGLGKRMHELVQAEASGSMESRAVLRSYNRKVVGALLWMTSSATVATYVVYTIDPNTRETFGTDYLALTSIFTLFGVLRFTHLVRSRPTSESPTEEMLRDKPFLANLALWGLAIIAILYFG